MANQFNGIHDVRALVIGKVEQQEGSGHHVRDITVLTADGAQKANARLIAAAPDLLKRMESMVSVFNTTDIDPLLAMVAIEQAKAAIAKATGGAEE